MEHYLITDPFFYTSKIDTFESRLLSVYKASQKNSIHLACFRDKTFINSKALSKSFVKISKKFNIKTLINSSIEIAYDTGANGVHLTSNQIDLVNDAKNKGLYTICSTHNIQEVYKAFKLGADAITYSPIFSDKYSHKKKGILGLMELIEEKIPIKIFALGGIVSNKHIKLLQKYKIDGFASIRYFINEYGK